MILFTSKNKQYKALGKDVSAEYKKRSEAVKKAMPVSSPDKIALGYALIDLWNSNSYSSKAKDCCKEFCNALKINCHSKVFFLVCEKEFSLDKSQVSRYMNIVDEFCIGSNLRDEWKAYSYSQLSELLSLTAEQRKEVKPDWSIKRIREYKKSLKPVATSQKKNDFEEPEEYKKLTRQQLIEYIIAYEEEKVKLSVELQKRGLSFSGLLENEDGE